MRRADKIGILLSLLAVVFSYWIARRYYENLAHLEDEMAYVWQAEVIARGHLTTPSPAQPDSFLWPFVVDYNGQRFGKYPPGWPALLAVGERFGQRDLVNPLLAGLAIWLIYRLGKRTLGENIGLLASALTLLSPFFLVNSASLLSHPFGLVLSAGFALAWLEAFGRPTSARPWLATLTAGILLGVMVLTRPFTALAVALPFGVHGLYLLARGDWSVRRRVLSLGAAAGMIGLLYFAWQYTVTGNALLNPYILWWPYDQIGFGPGHGKNPLGHTLAQAWINTRFSLQVGSWDLFGWPLISWIFIPIGLVGLVWPYQSLERSRRSELLLLSCVLPSLVIFYLAYWVGASLYGPRYYYEGIYSATLLSAAGIAYLAGWLPLRWPRRNRKIDPAENASSRADSSPQAGRGSQVRSWSVLALVTSLAAFNLVFYMPVRLEMMHGLYGVGRAYQQPFLSQSAQELTPALIIVHAQENWIEYGTLLELENPFLDLPFVFVYSRGPVIDQAVARQFPDRNIFHYYQDQPYIFYTAPRP